MKLNAEFDRRVLVRAQENQWVSSPMPGVDRKMLDRIGEEVARATSIVRYAPGSAFSAHTHDGGEEFIVLDGVFSDEHGDFPAGSYVRNPPTSSHTPRADGGATILVKLHQFDPSDRTHIRADIGKLRFTPDPDRPGVEIASLYADAHEDVRVERWRADASATSKIHDGLEAFVLSGSIREGGDELTEWDWLRLPDGAEARIVAGAAGALLWVKSGHLAGMT